MIILVLVGISWGGFLIFKYKKSYSTPKYIKAYITTLY